MVDAAGKGFTAFVAPDAEPEFFDASVATNHRGQIPELRRACHRPAERAPADRLAEVVAQQPTPEELAAAFQAEPLYNRKYSRAFGTLYTALYRPKDQVVEYIWPDGTWRRGFDDAGGTRTVTLVGS